MRKRTKWAYAALVITLVCGTAWAVGSFAAYAPTTSAPAGLTVTDFCTGIIDELGHGPFIPPMLENDILALCAQIQNENTSPTERSAPMSGSMASGPASRATCTAIAPTRFLSACAGLASFTSRISPAASLIPAAAW